MSGRNMVRKSIRKRVTRREAMMNLSRARPSKMSVAGKGKKIIRAIIARANSTMGYWTEIFCWQERQRPRRKVKDKMGIKSQAVKER